jgi:hypothetical protein
MEAGNPARRGVCLDQSYVWMAKRTAVEGQPLGQIGGIQQRRSLHQIPACASLHQRLGQGQVRYPGGAASVGRRGRQATTQMLLGAVKLALGPIRLASDSRSVTAWMRRYCGWLLARARRRRCSKVSRASGVQVGARNQSRSTMSATPSTEHRRTGCADQHTPPAAGTSTIGPTLLPPHGQPSIELSHHSIPLLARLT